VAVEAYQVRNLHLWRRLQRFVQLIRDKPEQHDIPPESITPSLSETLILAQISMWTKLPMNDFCSNKSWQQKGTYFAAAWDHALVAGDPFYTRGQCQDLSRALTEASDCAPALGLSWIIARLGRHPIGVIWCP